MISLIFTLKNIIPSGNFKFKKNIFFNRVFLAIFSCGLLQPKLEGPEEKSGVATVSIEQRTRTKIKAVL